MRLLLLLALVGVLLISVGCEKEPTPGQGKIPPRKLVKPGEKNVPQPADP